MRFLHLVAVMENGEKQFSALAGMLKAVKAVLKARGLKSRDVAIEGLRKAVRKIERT